MFPFREWNMPRYKPLSTADFTQSNKARELLRADTPPAVTQALRLAQRGGRQQRRRCRCGGQGVHCQIVTPDAVWGVESPANTTLRVFWVCPSCKAREDTKEPSS